MVRKRPQAARGVRPPSPAQDGRHRRAEQSRQRIVEAMLKLVGRGDMNPSPAEVAAEAGVGLRTVFRHFEEVDTLYREMAAHIDAEIMPLARAPLVAPDWRDNLMEMVKRRAVIFERIMPYRVAGAVRRFHSPYLMADFIRAARLEDEALKSVLPRDVLRDAKLVAALAVAMSFESWRRLRQDQGLSAKQAAAAIRFATERHIKGL